MIYGPSETPRPRALPLAHSEAPAAPAVPNGRAKPTGGLASCPWGHGHGHGRPGAHAAPPPTVHPTQVPTAQSFAAMLSSLPIPGHRPAPPQQLLLIDIHECDEPLELLLCSKPPDKLT